MAKYSVSRKTEINAPVPAIWKAIVNVSSWPEYKPFIKRIRTGSQVLGKGGHFKMWIRVKGPAVPVPVKVVEFDPPRRVAWTGGLAGLSVSVHSFILEQSENGTILTSREDFTGRLVRLMLLLVRPRDLERLHDDWLFAIKNKVEGNR